MEGEMQENVEHVKHDIEESVEQQVRESSGELAYTPIAGYVAGSGLVATGRTNVF